MAFMRLAPVLFALALAGCGGPMSAAQSPVGVWQAKDVDAAVALLRAYEVSSGIRGEKIGAEEAAEAARTTRIVFADDGSYHSTCFPGYVGMWRFEDGLVETELHLRDPVPQEPAGFIVLSKMTATYERDGDDLLAYQGPRWTYPLRLRRVAAVAPTEMPPSGASRDGGK